MKLFSSLKVKGVQKVAFNYSFLYNLSKVLKNRTLKNMSDDEYEKLFELFVKKCHLNEDLVDIFLGLCTDDANRDAAIRSLDEFCQKHGTDPSDLDDVMNTAVNFLNRNASQYLA